MTTQDCVGIAGIRKESYLRQFTISILHSHVKFPMDHHGIEKRDPILSFGHHMRHSVCRLQRQTDML